MQILTTTMLLNLRGGVNNVSIKTNTISPTVPPVFISTQGDAQTNYGG